MQILSVRTHSYAITKMNGNLYVCEYRKKSLRQEVECLEMGKNKNGIQEIRKNTKKGLKNECFQVKICL